MHWILQNNIFNETKHDELVEFLIHHNIPHSIHSVIPFVGDIYPVPDIEPYSNVICMGSYSLRHLAKKHNWFPGVFDLEPYDFTIQLQHWGNLMLNFDSTVIKFKDASIDTLSFIRPIHDSKVFAGFKIDPPALIEWQTNIETISKDEGSTMTGDTLIQVCSIKNIIAEYRYWIVDGQIITKSLYKRGSSVVYSDLVDERFDSFVRHCIDIWQPLDAFVIDVCELIDGQYKIVEINTINSSGYYAGDIVKLAQVLNAKYS